MTELCAQRIRAHWFLVCILALAFLLRFPGVGYGLPLQLYGDEQTNVYGALTMLEERTLLPVFHPDAFIPLLYAPPVTAYILTLAFIPTLGIDFVLSGFPSIHAFTQQLILDQTVLWYVARMLSVCASVANVLLVYAIARRLFVSERIALFSALLLATSFLDVSIAATARHWEFGLFFTLCGVYAALRALDASSTKGLVLAGSLLGTGVGAMYVALPAILAGMCTVAKDRFRFWERRAFLRLTALVVPSIVVGGLFILVHPYPLFTQSGTSAALARASIAEFFAYYGWALIAYDTLLSIAAVIGAIALCIKRPPQALPLMGSLCFAVLATYLLMPNFVRYIMPALPLVVLVGGYGIDALLTTVQSRHIRTVLVCAALAYSALLYGRYEWLIVQGDTRVAAQAWLVAQVPAHGTIIVDSNMIRLTPTRDAAATLERLAPSSVRGPDRAVLSGFEPEKAISAYQLLDTDAAVRTALVRSALATGTTHYLVTDSWWTGTSTYGVALTRVEQEAFVGQGTQPPLSLIHGGQPIDPLPTQILPFLYSVPAFGPDVKVYKVTPSHESN